ncbi:unnamed protein product [Euphydryas editha]|uniref:DUF4795 domain-containing protein n=1 Tax=Euphydryas editha TaxID=104508 RepID=A0AAU9U1J3_EUPED|nr:unnamed protein product [Euphydryas editha]
MPVGYDEPNMSDATLLVSVEDLINRALGSPDVNTVNFKLVQMILHILARQQRMLEQRVEIRGTDIRTPQAKAKKDLRQDSPDSSSSKSPRSPVKGRMPGIKEERDTKKDGKGKEDKGKKLQKDGKDDKGQQKDKTQKELAKVEKEKEKLDKATKKDKEREEKQKKQAEKEEEKKTREKVKKNKEGKRARVTSATSIAISEAQRDDEKVLVVEKGPTTRVDGRRPSIDIVTQSQFALLETKVKELQNTALPKPLVLPDNEKLKSDLAKGHATLPDTMQAMQVTARLKAAEDAINRMTGLLTQLAAAGELPEDIAEKVEEVKIEPPKEPEPMEEIKPVTSAKSVVSKKSVAIDPKASRASRIDARPRSHSAPGTHRPSQATSRQSTLSKHSTLSIVPGVTHDELNAALRELREELSKDLNSLTTRATTVADNALHTAMTLAEKLEIAVKLDARISVLYSVVEDYSVQLSGFDSGFSTQMQSFQDQMNQISADLKSGLTQLENVNNNAETAAVMELTERYQDLVTDLEATLHAHKTLTSQNSHLGGEMRSLVECVEMLREQKSDRDEVLDGLRDKADTTRLAGLLTEAEFAEARADFERRIAVCHDKFNRQDAVWMAAIKDLTKITDNKAEIVDLLSARDEAQKYLQLLDEKIRVLAAVLGEPKAALLRRQLAVGACCGACGATASMEAREAADGAPPPLPALRPPPADPPALPCITDWVGAEPEEKRHICHRWCGGSHTRITEATTKERASPAALEIVPTKKYTGYGDDGRLYMMEEMLEPCVECNQLSSDVQPPQELNADCGAGDSQPPHSTTPMQ